MSVYFSMLCMRSLSLSNMLCSGGVMRLALPFVFLCSQSTAFQHVRSFPQVFRPIAPHSFKEHDKQLSLSDFNSISKAERRQIGLFSLRRLVDDISTGGNKPYPRLVFVGGKGGVGKTTISSSLAVELAADVSKDLNVVIVSTDPAHSLGDALDVDFRSSNGRPVLLTDPLTGGRLTGCEIDPAAALEDFQFNLAAFDVQRLADSLGVPSSLLESLGLREFSGLLNNPPPGLDELVALSKVLDTANPNSVTAGADVVIVDTAPTGHTMRMLALPAFLDGLLGKLIEVRMKLSGFSSTLQAMFGNEEAEARAKSIDNAMDKVEKFRRRIAGLRARLRDSRRTSFLVVTIPTTLGVLESERLIKELAFQGISVSDIVVNQCLTGKYDADLSELIATYYDRRKSGQKKWISELKETARAISGSSEFKANGNAGPIKVSEVPFFDVELVGVPALSYLSASAFTSNDAFSYLMDDKDAKGSLKVVICGGKGGVGKTTISSALAVSMANSGHRVALVSTDPAHSLGDALNMNLSGGSLKNVPLYGAEQGSLSVMEIDPAASLSQFKDVVDSLFDSSTENQSKASGLGSTLRDLGEIFDTLPAGTDEVVALSKVIRLIKDGDYDRVVLDTAPTGHTLRMLSTPGFIAELIDRVLGIAQKVNSNPTIKMLLSGAAKRSDVNSVGEAAKSTLLSFQLQMYDLEDMFANAEQTEFLLVTIASELATRETTRLLNELTFEVPDMPIKVRNIVVNQVLDSGGSDLKGFTNRVAAGQCSSIERLKKYVESITPEMVVSEVRYLDTEPRGVFGLKALSAELLKEEVPTTVT